MWTVYRPDDLVAHDLDPARSPTGESVSFLSLPYEDREFGSCLFDPPYKFVGTPSDEDGDHDDRYGNTQRLGHTGQWQLIVDGAVECGRVTDQYLIVKCQRQVVLFNIFHQPYEITKAMAEHGWQLKDELLLPSYRAQPSGRAQRNSRSNYSTFVVLRRA